MTEDDDGEPSAAVLQRVNDAVSAVRWDHAERTPAPPLPGERVTQRMEPTTACRQARATEARAWVRVASLRACSAYCSISSFTCASRSSRDFS